MSFRRHSTHEECQASHENVLGQRLRQACNLCRTAKVKCTSSHPCQRCQENDLPCVYSYAAKAGKPRGTKNRRTLDKHAQLRAEADSTLLQTSTLQSSPPLERGRAATRPRKTSGDAATANLKLPFGREGATTSINAFEMSTHPSAHSFSPFDVPDYDFGSQSCSPTVEGPHQLHAQSFSSPGSYRGSFSNVLHVFAENPYDPALAPKDTCLDMTLSQAGEPLPFAFSESEEFLAHQSSTTSSSPLVPNTRTTSSSGNVSTPATNLSCNCIDGYLGRLVKLSRMVGAEAETRFDTTLRMTTELQTLLQRLMACPSCVDDVRVPLAGISAARSLVECSRRLVNDQGNRVSPFVQAQHESLETMLEADQPPIEDFFIYQAISSGVECLKELVQHITIIIHRLQPGVDPLLTELDGKPTSRRSEPFEWSQEPDIHGLESLMNRCELGGVILLRAGRLSVTGCNSAA